MSASLAESVFAALRAVGDPLTPPPQRQEATRYIEECRKDRAMILVMKSILESPQVNGDSTWCFLCLKLFEDCLFVHWNTLDYGDQTEIRKFVCGLVDLCQATLNSMPIRTKLAKIISELAKRQYPQLWESFVPDLLSSWADPGFTLKAQVCALSLEFLVEDCVDCHFNEGLPAKRRNDILTELKNKDLNSILDASYSVLSRFYGALTSAAPEAAVELVAAMNAVLGMLCPVALLAKPSDMTDPARNFAEVSVLLLRIEPLKVQALELLSRISRVGQILCREAYVGLLRTLPTALAATCAPSTVPSGGPLDGHIYYGPAAGRSDIDNLDHCKRLVDAASVLLTSSIELLQDRHDDSSIDREVDETLQNFLESLLVATVYTSSRRLYGDVVKHWQRLLKVPFIQKLPYMQGVVFRLLMMYVSSCSKVPWTTDQDEPSVLPYAKDEVLLVDFESADEFLGFYGVFRATVSDLVKEAARTFPVVAAAFMRGYLSFVLDRYGAFPIVSVHSEGYIETESCVLFLDGVCVTATAGVDPEVVLSGDLTALVECARYVLSWAPVAPLLVLNKMRCLSSVSAVLNASAPLTTACFEYLFQMLSYECTSIQDPTIEDQVMQVRRRTTASISALCCSLSILSKDLVLMEKIFTSASSFLQNTAVLHSQRTNMIETLVGLADKLPDLETRRAMLASVMRETISLIAGPDCGAMLRSPTDLLAYLEQCLVDGDKLSLLVNFKQAVNSFVGACRRVAAPTLPDEMWTDGTNGGCVGYDQLLASTAFGLLWRDVLPVICGALNSVLGVHAPAVRARIEGAASGGRPHPLSGLFVMAPLDIMDLTTAKQKPPAADIDPHAERVCSAFKELSLSMYHAVGCAIWHKVLYLHDECHRAVTESLASHVYCMETRQLRTVLKYIVQRYVLNIPRPCFAVGHPFIVKIFEHIRMRQEWMNHSLPCSLPLKDAESEFHRAERTGSVMECFQSEALFSMYIYRKSGISVLFHQRNLFSADQIEEARTAIVTDFNRKVMGTLGACFSVSDILSVQHSVAEKEKIKTAPSPKWNRDKGADGRVDSEQLEQHTARAMEQRRACVNSLVFGRGRDGLAALLLDLTLRGLQVPDQVLTAKALRIFQYLCTDQHSGEKHCSDGLVHGWTDERVGCYLGSAVFSTCLHALVGDERLLNLDFIILMEDILTRFEPLRSRINEKDLDTDTMVSFSEIEVMSMAPCAVLANSEGCSAVVVATMCSSMSGQKTKKSRRDALRDVVTDIMRHAKGSTTQNGSAIVNLPFPTRATDQQKKPSVSLLDQASSQLVSGWGAASPGQADTGGTAGLTELFGESGR